MSKVLVLYPCGPLFIDILFEFIEFPVSYTENSQTEEKLLKIIA